jgi:23S rRNA (adenine2503-C2)-methyltransferase
MQSYNPAKVYLLDHAREELVAYMAQLGQEKYRANQLFHAIYAQLLPDFDDLSTFSKNLRHQLNESTTLRSFTLLETVKSSRDNTKKFLWQLNDGKTIESVIIYEGKRVTFCISSQVGCVLDCKFCATGQMGFLRNLTSGEILEQVILMKQEAENLPTNIVFMGMGEPLLNMRNVLKASFILSDPRGLSFSQKKITISTSGIIHYPWNS